MSVGAVLEAKPIQEDTLFHNSSDLKWSIKPQSMV
jgi:hypothetical protein